MGKALTYFVVALAIIMGLTYMATQAESCNKKSPTSIHANDLDANNESDKPVEDTDDDIEEEPTDEHNDATGSTSSDEDADDGEVIPVDGTEEEYSDHNSTETTSTTIATNNSEMDGNFLVIAGAFKSESNAENEVAKLKNLGYPNAEIVEFEYSDYYSVCAARYDNSSDAEKVAISIKNKLGKKAYVHKKRVKNK